MADKKPFGAPSSCDQSEVPAYLQGGKRAGSVLQNPAPDDYGWVGDDGTLDPSQFVDELIAPHSLLRAVLLAVIDAHPLRGRSREDRLSDAVRALLNIDADGGRPEKTSYDGPLEAMSREYLLGFFGFHDRKRSARDLCFWALRQDPEFEQWSMEQQENRARTLQRRFQAQKDKLLAQFAARSDPEVQQALTKVRAAVDALHALGVRVAVGESDTGHGTGSETRKGSALG